MRGVQLWVQVMVATLAWIILERAVVVATRSNATLHPFSYDLVLLELRQISSFEQSLPSEISLGGTNGWSYQEACHLTLVLVANARQIMSYPVTRAHLLRQASLALHGELAKLLEPTTAL